MITRYYAVIKLRIPFSTEFYDELHDVYDSRDVSRCHRWIRTNYLNIISTTDVSYETDNGNVIMVMNENMFHDYRRFNIIAHNF